MQPTKKYFCVSDIHSFYVELKDALWKAGFRKTNKNHYLIVCGDAFDRGPDTVAVYKFLSSIPKKRCILIKGNHETLFKELMNKTYPQSHDFSNHTVDTFCQIAHRDVSELHCGDVSWGEIVDYVRSSKIWKWLNSKQWVDYYELDKYIFVHSFIPITIKEEYKRALYMYAPSQLAAKCFEYNPDWRNASYLDWEDARWGDPVERYLRGLFTLEANKGKTLVVGHWHISDFWKRISEVRNYDKPITAIWKGLSLIAIDSGVFYDSYGCYVHPQNVLVIDSSDFNTCYDKDGNIIKEAPEIDIIGIVTESNNND